MKNMKNWILNTKMGCFLFITVFSIILNFIIAYCIVGNFEIFMIANVTSAIYALMLATLNPNLKGKYWFKIKNDEKI